LFVDGEGREIGADHELGAARHAGNSREARQRSQEYALSDHEVGERACEV
jgi:hypothetical protein